ncbi:MAG: hypothetical protein LBR48_05980 [Dysgonamonadaceae bacterium]|nr:hypothetical protein [Dysgonamonadaceae bacterium]
MKTIYNVAGALLLCLTLTTSCYREDALTPSEGGIEPRFTLPQGNNPWDDDIMQIYEQYGVYLIYTDLEISDFNRNWVGTIGTDYEGYSSQNDAMTAGYVKFMKTHIFPYLTPQVYKKVLPMYWYMAYNVRANFFGFHTPQNNMFNGLDFWAMCMYGIPDPVTQEDFVVPVDQQTYGQRRKMVLGEIYKRAVNNGSIVIPNEFKEGFDFVTKLSSDPSSNDYFLTRGFAGGIYLNKFNGTSRVPVNNDPAPTMSVTFVDYIHLMMYYTEDELNALYGDYPFLTNKLSIVYNLMKDQYGIDLHEVCAGPADWQSF